MNVVKEIGEDEMIATFLQAEVDSPRFKQKILDYLKTENLPLEIVINPNLSDKTQNEVRKKILSAYRDYQNRIDFFENFPKDINWYRVELSKKEVECVKYINYSYWNKISDNTRLASLAARNILNRRKVFNEPNDNFLQAAEVFKKGYRFPEMILVAPNMDSDLVVLEGHLRLTAMALSPDAIPDKTTAILGISPKIRNWDLY